MMCRTQRCSKPVVSVPALLRVLALTIFLVAVLATVRPVTAQDLGSEIQTLLQQGKYAEAETRLAGAADAGSVRAMLLLARLDANRGNAARALGSLNRALQLAPNSEDVLAAFAQVNLGAGHPGPAILALEGLVRMHPADASYAYLLGVARLQVGQLSDAVAVLAAAAELEPSDARHHLALGLGLNRLKRFDEAYESLQRAAGLAPDDVETLAALAEAEQGLGRKDDAERHALRVLSVDPDHVGALFVQGLLHMDAQRYAEARDAFTRVLGSDPDAAKVHYQLSLAYARLGDREASKRHVDEYQRSLRLAEERLKELQTQPPLFDSNERPDSSE